MAYDFSNIRDFIPTHPGLRKFQEAKKRRKAEAIAKANVRNEIRIANPGLDEDQIDFIVNERNKDKSTTRYVSITNRKNNKQYVVLIKNK